MRGGALERRRATTVRPSGRKLLQRSPARPITGRMARRVALGWSCPSSGWSSRARLRLRRAPTPTSSGPTPRRQRAPGRSSPAARSTPSSTTPCCRRPRRRRRATTSSENGNGPVTVRGRAVATSPSGGGENVTSVKGWGYASTGDLRTLDSELRHGATVLASGTWPSSVPRHVAVDDLHRVADPGRARRPPPAPHAPGRPAPARRPSSTPSYAEVHTDMASPAPTITARPASPSQDDQPVVVVHRDAGRRRSSAASRRARPIVSRLGRLHERPRATTSPATGRRRLHLPRPRARRPRRRAAPTPRRPTRSTASAPNAPTIDSGPPRPVEQPDRHVVVHGRGRRGHSCRLTRGATVVSDWTLCTSPPSYDLGGRGRRRSTPSSVYSTDLAGNDGRDRDRHLHARPRRARPRRRSPRPRRRPSNSEHAVVVVHARGGRDRRPAASSAARPSSATGRRCTSPKAWDLTEPAGRHLHLPRPARPTPRATRAPSATGTYVLDNAAPAAPTITARPDRRARRTPRPRTPSPARPATTLRVPHRARRDGRQRLVGLRQPPQLRPQPPGRRRLHLPRPRDRRGDEHGRRGDAQLHARPHRARRAGHHLGPGRRVLGRHADLRLHRRSRARRTSAACGAGRPSSSTGRPAPPRTRRPLGPGRRRLHVLRPLDRRGRQHRPGRHARLHARPQRARRRRPSPAGRPATRRTRRRATRSRSGAGETAAVPHGARRHGRSATGPPARARARTTSPPRSTGPTPSACARSTRASNIGGDITRSYALDRTAPVAPTITSSPPATSNGDLAVRGRSRRSRARAPSAASSAGRPSSATGPPARARRRYDLASQADGTYTFRVRATDAAEQHRHRRDRHLRPRPRRRRRRRRSRAARPATRRTTRRPTRSRARRARRSSAA